MTADELSKSADAVIVDVRKAPDDRMIPGSVRMDGQPLEASQEPPFTAGTKVVLYCGSGNSSTRIAAVLRERGVNADVLEGGYAAWKAAGLPTEPIA
jgi:rhodanese-related sulfurtransferase